MIFADRIEAAVKLADALRHYRGSRPLVLAIPRGAVAMADVLARRLDGEMDVVLVRKLHAPHSEEFAVGAVDESGWAYVAPHAAQAGADAQYLAREQREQMAELKRRRQRYTGGREAIVAAGRTVIVVDDGLATGATMIAALHAVRQRRPARLVCAVPVAAPDSLALVRPYADEVVCLHSPADFYAVGQFYRAFPQVDDEEVVALLARTGPQPGAEGAR